MTSLSSLTVLIFLLFTSSFSLAGENCSMLGGRCLDACGQNEEAQQGAFEDCGEKQECCLARDPSEDKVKCCIYSFDAGNYRPLNCGLPTGDRCEKGSGSTMACEQLKMCKEKGL